MSLPLAEMSPALDLITAPVHLVGRCVPASQVHLFVFVFPDRDRLYAFFGGFQNRRRSRSGDEYLLGSPYFRGVFLDSGSRAAVPKQLNQSIKSEFLPSKTEIEILSHGLKFPCLALVAIILSSPLLLVKDIRD